MDRINLSQEYDCPLGGDTDIEEPNLLYRGKKIACRWCGGEHVAGVDVLVVTIRDWREYLDLPESQEELQAIEAEAVVPAAASAANDIEAELQALRKQLSTYQARTALDLPPYAPLALHELRDLTCMLAGAPWPDEVLPELGELLTIYDNLRNDHLRPVDPAKLPRKVARAVIATGRLSTAARVYAPAVHPDDAAVDRFAAEMKAKLAQAREKGRSGWENKTTYLQTDLAIELRNHANKGDPVDVANFAMFLHQRGESTKLPPLSQELLAAIKNAAAGGSVIEHGGLTIFINRETDDSAPTLIIGTDEGDHLQQLRDQVERLCDGLEHYRNTAPWSDADEEELQAARALVARSKGGA